MRVFYKCTCLDHEVGVDVPDRLPHADLVYWVETIVGNNIGYDHSHRSPLCRSVKMEYMKIPIADGTNQVGVKKVIN